MTITAATAGSKPVGAATNIWGTASGAPDSPVSVQVLVNSAWSTSRSGTTSSSGSYVLPLTYGINTPGTYSYRTVVQTTSGYVVSPTVTLTRTGVVVSAATAGSKPVGAATSIWGTASGAPSRPVSVQVLVNGAWSTSRSGTTSSSGSYALPLTYGITTPGTYSFRAVVQTSYGYAVSPTVTLTRTGVVVTAATAGSREVGLATNIWGTASGAPSRPVSVQVLVNGAWSTSRSGTTSSSGSYALPLTYGINTPGTYSFRAVVQTSYGYAVSPTVTLKRTQRTLQQSQAMATARDYLESMAFSRAGLIDQLEYEGFSNADATYAVDNIGVNWREQAPRMARNYLDALTFSRAGLIDQLEYEGFSNSDATYGVDAVSVDWMRQAYLTAVEYLEYDPSFTRAELVDQLLYEGFTAAQADYGVSAAGL